MDHQSLVSIHPSTAPYHDDITKPALALSFNNNGTVASCFTTVSDTKTLSSTLEVKPVPMATPLTPSLLPHMTNNNLPSVSEDEDKLDEGSHHVGEIPDPIQSSMVSGADADIPSKRRKPFQKKASGSRESSVSSQHHRSASSSTAGGSVNMNRRGSLPLSNRTAAHGRSSPSNTQRSSLAMSPKKREDLLALHRDCCRLFQDPGLTREESHQDEGDQLSNGILGPQISSVNAMSTIESSRTPWVAKDPLRSSAVPVCRLAQYCNSTSSEPASPNISPLQNPLQHSISSPISGGDHDHDLEEQGVARQTSSIQSEGGQHYLSVPSTVIDWTSAATRRQQYEKIDRSNRGIRGLWRKLAPKCIQPSPGLTPFFEEGKAGKGNYEGSVRRFRMDLPDEKRDPDAADESDDPSSPRKPPRRELRRFRGVPLRWSCLSFKPRWKNNE